MFLNDIGAQCASYLKEAPPKAQHTLESGHLLLSSDFQRKESGAKGPRMNPIFLFQIEFKGVVVPNRNVRSTM